MGDGECDEGSVWEAAMYANHYGLNNLVAIVDHNKMQSLDYCENTMKLSPFADKWRSFGWNCLEIDGHDHDALKTAFAEAKTSDKPTCIIANTVKGTAPTIIAKARTSASTALNFLLSDFFIVITSKSIL